MAEDTPQLTSQLTVDFGQGRNRFKQRAGKEVSVPIEVDVPAFKSANRNTSEAVVEVRLYSRHPDATITEAFKPFKRDVATQVVRPGDTVTDTITFNPVTVSKFAKEIDQYNRSSEVGIASSDSILNPDLSYEDSRVLYAEVDVSYTVAGTLEYQTDSGDELSLTVQDPDQIVEEIGDSETRELNEGLEDESQSTLKSAITGQDAPVSVQIFVTNYESDAPDNAPEEIAFEFERPAVSVDSKGRFVTHEIIGDSTVRQKIGEEPLEIEVTGVCREDTLRDIHTLRNATRGEIQAPQLPTGDEKTIPVQFASVSTSPLEDGGAVQLTSGSFLYEYEMSLTEVNV